MKKIVILVSIALVLGLVIGCPQPNDSGGGSLVPVFEDITGTGVGTIKAITGGTFERDNDATGSGTETTNIIVSNFYLGETEVTQAQYEAVMKANPSNNKTNVNLPVEMVYWYDAIKFCNQLSIDEGLEPVYYSGENYPDSPNINRYTYLRSTPNADFNKNGYRLPTEAKWEYAAGGGESSARTIYAGTSNVHDLGLYAWYDNNANKTNIVGTAGSTDSALTIKSGKSNALGLYDMSGNVFEWCWDYYEEYDVDKRDNPTGPTTGSLRIARGGSWYRDELRCRVAFRYGFELDSNGANIGFRVARSASN